MNETEETMYNLSMIRRALQILGIFVLACGASAVLMFVLTMGAQSLVNLGREPQYYLPADQTVFFVHKPTEELLSVLGGFFPETPLPEERGYALAGIRMDDGTIGTVVFAESSEPNLGRFAVTASHQEILTILGALPTLANNETFSLLQRNSKDSWLYTEATDQPENALRDAFWNHLALNAATHMVIDRIENGWHIGMAGPTTPRKTMQTLMVPKMDAVQTLALGSPASLWTNMLSENADIGIQTALRTTVASVAGAGISPLYDLLPLLQKPITLHLSGATTIALQGSAHAKVMTATLEKISKSFGNIEPETDIETQVLDNRFASTNIRLKTLQTEETEEHGWTVRRQRHGADGAVLIHAIRGNEFIISTSSELVQKLITNPPTVAIPLPTALAQKLPTAAGHLQKEFLPSFLQTIEMPPEMIWSLTERPNRTDLVLFPFDPTQQIEM